MTWRERLNNSIGRFQSQRTLRKEYESRTLLVANHWDGSVQQFYHFFLGYFMPLCLWLENNKTNRVAVRDCGPMNIWFELLQPDVDIQIMPPGAALHAVVGDRMKFAVLQGMDDPRSFRKANLESGIQAVLRQIRFMNQSKSESIDVLVIDRATSESFYHGPESETHMSGKERRHVPNLEELRLGQTSDKNVKFVDFARIEPADQLNLAQNSSALVGQHGAGLVHMLWLRPGSHVVEIAPPLPVQVIEIFERLAQVLGHSYSRVPQEDVHSPVDLDELKNAIFSMQG
jgi:hypothetical protein